jgi:hypothetical protein
MAGVTLTMEVILQRGERGSGWPPSVPGNKGGEPRAVPERARGGRPNTGAESEATSPPGCRAMRAVHDVRAGECERSYRQ